MIFCLQLEWEVTTPLSNTLPPHHTHTPQTNPSKTPTISQIPQSLRFKLSSLPSQIFPKMEDYMRGCTRKLALWYTRTFKPIMNHDELEPIMATLGFVGLPPSSSSAATKEYVFSSAGGWRSKWAPPAEAPLPRPRLPSPRIDGLHIYTYRAFIDAVNFYLRMSDISDLFHVRGMPLHDLHGISDRNRKWRKMEEDDSVFVYREGTLDQATFNLYHSTNKSISNSTASNGSGGSSVTSDNSVVIREKGNNTPVSCIVPLKDIIV